MSCNIRIFRFCRFHLKKLTKQKVEIKQQEIERIFEIFPFLAKKNCNAKALQVCQQFDISYKSMYEISH